MGTWLIWDATIWGVQLKPVWGVLIGFAGLVSVVQPILNYARVMDASGNALTRWTDLHIEFERMWLCRGELTENAVAMYWVTRLRL